MKYFKVLINRKKPGHWTAFEIKTDKPRYHFYYLRNKQYFQWFCYATVFPFYFSKNNCVITFGLYLLWIKIGFHIQGNFFKGKRRVKLN